MQDWPLMRWVSNEVKEPQLPLNQPPSQKTHLKQEVINFQKINLNLFPVYIIVNFFIATPAKKSTPAKFELVTKKPKELSDKVKKQSMCLRLVINRT